MSTREPGDECRLAAAALQRFPAEVAILDVDGEIVSTNLAWRAFAEANGYRGDVEMVGVNYLDVCDAAAAADGDAAVAATGLRAVFAGRRDGFDFEYPCHSPDERRWFLMRAVPFTVDGGRYVLVSHLNVTERKLAELDVRERTTQLEGIATLLSEDVQRELSTALGRAVLLNRELGTARSIDLEGSLHRVNALLTDALALLTGEDVDLVSVDLEASAKAAWRKVDTLDATLTVDATGVLAADVGLLGRLFQHLFECALVLGGTDVHVSVGTNGDGLHVEFDREQAVSTTVDGRSTADCVESNVAVASRIAEVHGWTLTTDADGTVRYEVSGVEWRT
ncbi:PAS fold-containing protein [Halogranum amylolyticum]|uniref:PAS fold-containing protein n=1 Tax=Halogranum amylolyticum TaxID=660520 RepID=A0A1H8SNZ4_9EURY|nr:PAS domain-containing protein [Halogranum amylolyticum]SEO80442.1 PAS fold-containing protein [Halogranum amylolyticum]